MAVEVGSKAPDFTLSDANKEKVSLESLHSDKNVLLVFYPFAFSGICTGELCQVRDEITEYQNDKVQVVGISVDAPFSLKAWAKQEGYTFPLLSDFWPHGEVAQAYGVFNEASGMANRGTFPIDTTGVVRFAEINGPGEARDQNAWKKAIAELA
jgi:peroxiredoxin (alkyl hydroperoxide reductase subunit C)